ncbi:MAG: hypothetical protein K0M69_00525, partial [Youngiibacter sp.]|nr:hypothetical protein [Youngiibacter sp.]
MVQYSITTRQKNGKWAYQIQIKDGDSWKYHSGKQGFEKKKDAIAAAQKVANGIEIQPEVAKDSFKAIADLYINSGIRSENSIRSYNFWLKNFEPIYDKRMTE